MLNLPFHSVAFRGKDSNRTYLYDLHLVTMEDSKVHHQKYDLKIPENFGRANDFICGQLQQHISNEQILIQNSQILHYLDSWNESFFFLIFLLRKVKDNLLSPFLVSIR